LAHDTNDAHEPSAAHAFSSLQQCESIHALHIVPFAFHPSESPQAPPLEAPDVPEAPELPDVPLDPPSPVAPDVPVEPPLHASAVDAASAIAAAHRSKCRVVVGRIIFVGSSALQQSRALVGLATAMVEPHVQWRSSRGGSSSESDIRPTNGLSRHASSLHDAPHAQIFGQSDAAIPGRIVVRRSGDPEINNTKEGFAGNRSVSRFGTPNPISAPP
jgi:hypothetical protein